VKLFVTGTKDRPPAARPHFELMDPDMAARGWADLQSLARLARRSISADSISTMCG